MHIALDATSRAFFVDSFVVWTTGIKPSSGRFLSLSTLTGVHFDELGDLYEDLAARTAWVDKNGVVHRFGPTGAAKVLLLLYGESVPAWDNGILRRLVGGDSSRDGYIRYLHLAQSSAMCLEDQLLRSRSMASSVGTFIGRAPASTAYILDTAAYQNM